VDDAAENVAKMTVPWPLVELLMGLYRATELRHTISFGDEDLSDYISPVGRPAGA
jgi:hypothetical protein